MSLSLLPPDEQQPHGDCGGTTMGSLADCMSKLKVARAGSMLPVPADDPGEIACVLPARAGHPPGSTAQMRETDLAVEWLYHADVALKVGCSMDMGLVMHLRDYIERLHQACPWGYDDRLGFPNQAASDLRMELGTVATLPVRALVARTTFLQKVSRVLHALLRLLLHIYQVYHPGEVADLEASTAHWGITL